jgi:hypothetical protein
VSTPEPSEVGRIRNKNDNENKIVTREEANKLGRELTLGSARRSVMEWTATDAG